MNFVVLGFLLALVLVADAGVSVHNEFYCYSIDPIRPQTQMHATLTSYETVRRTVDLPISSKISGDKITSRVMIIFYSLFSNAFEILAP